MPAQIRGLRVRSRPSPEHTQTHRWVDTHGRLREIFRDERGRIYGAGYLTVQIPLPDPDQQRTSTFYNRHGDWFGWGCVAFAACTILATAMRPRMTER